MGWSDRYTNPWAKLWTMFVIFAGVGITVSIIPLAFETMIGRKIKEGSFNSVEIW